MTWGVLVLQISFRIKGSGPQDLQILFCFLSVQMGEIREWLELKGGVLTVKKKIKKSENIHSASYQLVLKG